MGEVTGIAWCDHTFNPWIGCTEVSPACDHCYARVQDHRWGHDRWGAGKPRTRTSAANWRKVLAWNAAAKQAGVCRKVFCASMADWADSEVDPAWRADLFELIRACDWLDFLLLTKRPHNIAKMLPPDWGPGWANVWLGTTAEDQKHLDLRMPPLLRVPAVVHFLSYEPALGPIDASRYLKLEHDNAERLDWIIVGGESGAKPRRFDVAWARSIVRQCRAANAWPFVKQLGAFVVDRNDAGFTGNPEDQWPDMSGELDRVEENINGFREDHQGAPVRVRMKDRSHGGDPAEWPADLRVREFPEAP